MKNFAFIRVEKLKTFGNISASAQHCFRERVTPNAVVDRLWMNQQLAGDSGHEAVIQGVRERLAGVDKRDKQAALCLEYVVTASHEAMKAMQDGGDGYLHDAYEWIKQKHGAENVVSASVHYDEKTPHLCVYVVPVVNVAEKARKRSVNVKGGGRVVKDEIVPAHTLLSAKHFTGGREKLSKLQTDFANEVGKKHALVRGISRVEALKRKKPAEWYDEQNKALSERENELVLREKDVKTRESAVSERESKVSVKQQAVTIVSDSITKSQAALQQRENAVSLRENDVKTRENDLISRENEVKTIKARLNELLEDARKKIKLFTDAFNALSDHQKAAVVKAEPAVAGVVLKKKTQGVSI